MRPTYGIPIIVVALLTLAGCGATPAQWVAPTPTGSPAAVSPTPAPAPTEPPVATLPAPGNPGGRAPVPAEARAEDTSQPTRVIGDGTPASCTSAAVVAAVAAGGVITFYCGPAPVTITMKATAKVRNANGPTIVLDGGGKVTLSGGGKRRILYMNTCDKAQGWTTSHCQDQDHPRLTVQNLTFADGNSTGETTEGGGGGAIFVRGGRFKVVNSRFVRNRCDQTGPDLGGAAIRVLSQYQGKPVYVVNSTFGGASGQGGVCSNGGALSQHRRLVGGAQQRAHPQHGDRPGRQPGPRRHPGRRQRRRDLHRRQPVHDPDRRLGRRGQPRQRGRRRASSSSATTAPAR